MSASDEFPHAVPSPVHDVIAGRYRLVDRIGTGGMAEVYRARDDALGRDVALKIFRREFASAEDLRRQRHEIRLLANFSHPALVTLFDATSDAGGRAVLVLEYIKGADARERLRSGVFDLRTAAAIGADIARALAYIHEQGVLHRDVSPSNILLPESLSAGVAAKLTDLGIARLIDDAKLTATGSIIGTASYLSPEQAQGTRLTPATDIYSLGLVLLELVTGRREFPGTAVESATARLSRDPSIPDTLSPGWSDLLTGMTTRDPAQRPTSAAVADRLTDLAVDEGTTTRPATAPEPVTMPMPFDESATSGPTRRLPLSDPGKTGPTQILPGSVTPEVSAGLVRSRSRRHILAVVAGLGVLVVVLAGIMVAGPLAGGNHPTPDPVSSYPTVGGTLGDHLKQLEHQVARTSAP